MGWTTGQTPIQVVNTLVSAGATFHAAATAIYSLAWTKNQPQVLWGTLVQCTTGWNDGDPRFSYDSTLSYGNTNQTLAQVAAALVSAGARQEQATAALHSLAWTPSKPKTMWGVLVSCTTSWNGGDPRFSYSTAPS